TVAQCSFEEAPEKRSSPVKRALLRPGRWQVIQDSAHGRASFFDLSRDPQALAATPVGGEEFSALLDVLLGHGRPEARTSLRPSAPVRFSPAVEHELDQLGYGAAVLAGQGDAGALR